MDHPHPPAPVAVPFSMGGIPLLAKGQSRITLVEGERLISHVMVIAEGGETRMHAHRHEEHIFFVLAGQARFMFLASPEPVDLGPVQGILIPADCFYSFRSVGEQNLVLARVGSRRGPDAQRVGLDGLPLRGKSDHAGWQPGVVEQAGHVLADLFSHSQR